ncbi:MAG: hypothetical protein OXB92_16865, partial [Acidimicrobiaceae bacterium]|nr:hypothetical protein [Acidimicrobiaceae bacterium]
DNWNVAKTFTVTGEDVGTSAITHAATSTDTNYEISTAGTVTVTVTAAVPTALALTTNAASNTVAEDGGSVQVTATLNEEATAEVVVTLTATGTATSGSDYTLPVAFTIVVGDTTGTGTVQITDDDVDEGNETIILSATAGSLTVTGVTVTITDGDTHGVTVSESSVSVDKGATVEYTVVLDSEPTAEVVVTPTSGMQAKATVLPAAVTFTPANWDSAQTFTVSGVDAGTSTISHAATSGDSQYSGEPVDSVTVSVSAVPGVSVSVEMVSVVVGSTVEYTVVLDTVPSADVTVTPASSDELKATVSGALTFTSDDWRSPQTFTVSGVALGSVVVSHAVTSSDSVYDAVLVGSVGVSVVPATVTLVSNLGQSQTSGGAFATSGIAGIVYAQNFRTGGNEQGYVLDSAAVRVRTTGGAVSAADRAKIKAELWSAELVSRVRRPRAKLADLVTPSNFGAGNMWFSAPEGTVLQPNTNYFVVVYVDDSTGALGRRIQLWFTNSDNEDGGAAAGWGMDNGFVRILGSFTPSGTWQANAVLALQIGVSGYAVPPPEPSTLTLTTNAASGTVAEGGGSVTVTATLDEEATAEVSVTLTATGTAMSGSDYTLPAAFTIAVGDTTGTGTVQITNDDVDEGNETIILSATVGDLTVAGVTLTITDDDTHGLTVSESSVSVVKGATVEYTVVLDSEPTAQVVVTPTSGMQAKATVLPAAATFTASNWDTVQTFTVSGVDAGTSVTAPASTSADSLYNGEPVGSVTATVTAAPGVTLSTETVSVVDRSMVEYTVVLATAPSDSVTVTAMSADLGKATVSGAV